jgi:quercetin 2,3-dioxygenase
MAYFARSGSDISISSSSVAKILIMAGKPLDEPIAAYGPFVMNTQTEIMQAFADLNAGKMGRIQD